MSEDKKDIQAQVDRLDLDWEREREPFMVQDHERSPKRAPKNPLWISVVLWVFLALLVVRLARFGYDCFTYTSPSYLLEEVSWIESNWVDLLFTLPWVPITPYFFREQREKMGRYKEYVVGLGEYESKRAELQAKLDALD
jgi:hypothetical protein